MGTLLWETRASDKQLKANLRARGCLWKLTETWLSSIFSENCRVQRFWMLCWARSVRPRSGLWLRKPGPRNMAGRCLGGCLWRLPWIHQVSLVRASTCPVLGDAMGLISTRNRSCPPYPYLAARYNELSSSSCLASCLKSSWLGPGHTHMLFCFNAIRTCMSALTGLWHFVLCSALGA